MESIFRSIECIENSEHGEPATIVCLFKILENFWYLSQNEEHESDDKESANRVKTSDKESKVLQNISDIGNFSAIYLN